ncbi:MAG: c-type cytochrome domain-containing protein [Bacteroidota bacterium]
MIRKLLIFLGSSVLVAGITNCTSTLSDEEELIIRKITDFATVDTCGDNVVLFQQQVLPLLESSCAYSTCHDADFRAGGISMSSYEEIAPQISPGSPEQSLLYQLVTNPDPSQIMPPPPRNQLQDPFINMLRVWIEQGAKNTICKDRCSYRPVRIENILCNDNGTPEIAEDDSISFTIDPQGKNLGEKYILTGPGVNLTVEYGSPLNFSFPVGDHITLKIKDIDDELCNFIMEIPTSAICRGPSTPPVIDTTDVVADTCKLQGDGMEDIACFDNGTPSDSTDDRILFSLNPFGSTLGSGYLVTGIQGDSSFSAQGDYGDTNAFQTPPGYAGRGDITLIIQDLGDSSCTIQSIVPDPGACSTPSVSEDTCKLADAGLGEITCNDNGTPEDPRDDFFTFTLSPSGTDLGSGFVASTDSLQWEGMYGQVNTFETPVGSLGKRDLTLTITDDSSSDCSITLTITDPQVCSDTCDVSDVSYSNTILPIFEAKCISCHNGPDGSGGVDLSTYEKIKEQVDSGSLLGSILGDPEYALMPPQGKLPLCEIQQIELWIDKGAKED